ncbi:2-C-methyl-D-erythritol 4-phosphate cytidylyltransferase [Planctomycetota bacterium]|nr:2-C-methyl-D-erythritol 4-phosphate cytidylyltransferase [Planctomycetota bacterium]MDC3251793.1 2-C-methyl-D-erythritol 4-phosphate cytidylyltransferase [Planctomycetota bacterium]
MRYWSIVVAAGDGTRLGQPVRKAAVQISGQALATISSRASCQHAGCEGLILVVHSDDVEIAANWVNSIELGGLSSKVVVGGSSRRESVRRGFEAIEAAGDDLVAIHDAARPLLHPDDLARVLEEAERSGAAILASPVTDTLHRGDGNACWNEIVDRENLWQAQTPQVFRHELLKSALAHAALAHADGEGTDEVEGMAHIGQPVQMLESLHPNPKITTPADLLFVEFMTSSQGR